MRPFGLFRAFSSRLQQFHHFFAQGPPWYKYARIEDAFSNISCFLWHPLKTSMPHPKKISISSISCHSISQTTQKATQQRATAKNNQQHNNNQEQTTPANNKQQARTNNTQQRTTTIFGSAQLFCLRFMLYFESSSTK